jgi:hypothetical protein
MRNTEESVTLNSETKHKTIRRGCAIAQNISRRLATTEFRVVLMWSHLEFVVDEAALRKDFSK